jgi:hypothetical protein
MTLKKKDWKGEAERRDWKRKKPNASVCKRKT